jgi:AraC-like DNA-binding protein
MKKFHYSNIKEYNDALGISPPGHPLFDISHISSDEISQELSCHSDATISNDFYTISIKNIQAGAIHYGRTQYDYSNGTMIFTSPRQELRTMDVKIKSSARCIVFHEDYVLGHSIKQRLDQYHFFNYSVNEALHLAPDEAKHISAIFDAIENEHLNANDDFTKELILSQLDTILRYADRFYHRQFEQRKRHHQPTVQQFEQWIDKLVQSNPDTLSVETIAYRMRMSKRYLSDVLKVETGFTAKECLHLRLINLSKERLLSTDQAVASIAYALGFQYPQYFARLFKKKVGMTPTQFRQQHRSITPE